MFKELYKYREFLKTSVLKEFRGKYKKSFLGVLWSFLNPLFQLIIYSLVFPFLLRGSDINNYIIFLMVALIPWNFFNTTVIQSSASIVANGGIIKKIYFPRIILPISTTISNLINFFITGIIILIFLFITGIGVSKTIIFLPFIILIQFIFQLGIAFILSAITVFVRDIEYLIGLITMLLFYLCPIVYPVTMIPNNLLTIFHLNPMYHIIKYYREILYYQQVPNLATMFLLFIFSILFLIFGYYIFKKCEKRFAEEL